MSDKIPIISNIDGRFSAINNHIDNIDMKRTNQITNIKKINWFEILLLLLVIFLFVILFLVLYYAYQWILYYIDIGEQYVDNFNNTKAEFQQDFQEIKDSFNGIGHRFDNLKTQIDEIEMKIDNINSRLNRIR